MNEKKINELMKKNNSDYYFTKQAHRNLILQVVKGESKEELEKEVIRYYSQMEKAKEYLYNKKLLTPKKIENLWNILSFTNNLEKGN